MAALAVPFSQSGLSLLDRPELLSAVYFGGGIDFTFDRAMDTAVLPVLTSFTQRIADELETANARVWQSSTVLRVTTGFPTVWNPGPDVSSWSGVGGNIRSAGGTAALPWTNFPVT